MKKNEKISLGDFATDGIAAVKEYMTPMLQYVQRPIGPEEEKKFLQVLEVLNTRTEKSEIIGWIKDRIKTEEWDPEFAVCVAMGTATMMRDIEVFALSVRGRVSVATSAAATE